MRDAFLAEEIRRADGWVKLRIEAHASSDHWAALLNTIRAAPRWFTKLELSCGRVTSATLVEFGLALAQNTSLSSLNFEANLLGCELAVALGKALKVNRTLRELNLSYNDLGNIGGMALAAGLRVNTAVTTLNLCMNDLGCDGGMAIASAIETNRDIPLRSLNLRGNELGSSSAGALIQCLQSNSTLTEIDLRDNRIDSLPIAEVALGPGELAKRFSSVRIYLEGNESISDPPYSACSDPESLVAYINDLKCGSTRLQRVRLVACGFAGVGKTTLVQTGIYNRRYWPSDITQWEPHHVSSWASAVGMNQPLLNSLRDHNLDGKALLDEVVMRDALANISRDDQQAFISHFAALDDLLEDAHNDAYIPAHGVDVTRPYIRRASDPEESADEGPCDVASSLADSRVGSCGRVQASVADMSEQSELLMLHSLFLKSSCAVFFVCTNLLHQSQRQRLHSGALLEPPRAPTAATLSPNLSARDHVQYWAQTIARLRDEPRSVVYAFTFADVLEREHNYTPGRVAELVHELCEGLDDAIAIPIYKGNSSSLDTLRNTLFQQCRTLCDDVVVPGAYAAAQGAVHKLQLTQEREGAPMLVPWSQVEVCIRGAHNLLAQDDELFHRAVQFLQHSSDILVLSTSVTPHPFPRDAYADHHLRSPKAHGSVILDPINWLSGRLRCFLSSQRDSEHTPSCMLGPDSQPLRGIFSLQGLLNCPGAVLGFPPSPARDRITPSDFERTLEALEQLHVCYRLDVTDTATVLNGISPQYPVYVFPAALERKAPEYICAHWRQYVDNHPEFTVSGRRLTAQQRSASPVRTFLPLPLSAMAQLHLHQASFAENRAVSCAQGLWCVMATEYAVLVHADRNSEWLEVWVAARSPHQNYSLLDESLLVMQRIASQLRCELAVWAVSPVCLRHPHADMVTTALTPNCFETEHGPRLHTRSSQSPAERNSLLLDWTLSPEARLNVFPCRADSCRDCRPAEGREMLWGETPQLLHEPSPGSTVLVGSCKRPRASSHSSEYYDVFLCHHGPDSREGFVRVVYSLLTALGIHAFFDDSNQTLPDAVVRAEVAESLWRCDVGAVFVSRHLVQSERSCREVNTLLRRSALSGTTVLPIYHHVSPHGDRYSVLRAFASVPWDDSVPLREHFLQHVMLGLLACLYARSLHVRLRLQPYSAHDCLDTEALLLRLRAELDRYLQRRPSRCKAVPRQITQLSPPHAAARDVILYALIVVVAYVVSFLAGADGVPVKA